MNDCPPACDRMTGAAAASGPDDAMAVPAPSPDAGAGTPSAGAPPARPDAGTDWRAALPDELKPVAEAKGWRAPADALKSYVHLERLVGADRIALPPKDAAGNRDWAKWDGWTALGRPEAPERYAFHAAAGQAFSDGDRAFQAHMAPLLHRAGLAQWQVDMLTGGLAEYGERHRSQAEQHAGAQRAAAEAELRREWGGGYERQMDLANRALRAFGGPEAVRALSDSGAGRDPAVVRAFARIGAALAEDGDLPGERRAAPEPAASQARLEIQRLKADPEFQAAFLDKMHPGHPLAMAKMLRLQSQTGGETG